MNNRFTRALSGPKPARTLLAAAAVFATVSLTGCDGRSSHAEGGVRPGEPIAGQQAQPVRVSTNIDDPAAVPVDLSLAVTAKHATLDDVHVTSASGSVAGEVSGASWRASERLEPDTAYVVRVRATDGAGETVTKRLRIHTQSLTLDEQTYPSVAPLPGETVGVGMPVIVTFDLPVTDRAAFEKHMQVTSTPAQSGSWHWISDREAHWRPKDYWQPHTQVHVDLDLNSLPAGGGIYGQESRTIDFTIGDSVISKVDAQSHQLRTFINGKLTRTFPITTGKPGFTTRSGVKVIMEKFESKRMNSETVGINAGDPEAYDIDNVQYAMRLTSSGEFIHAAPWSVGSQGVANVSHGCTGMSVTNAQWLYGVSKRGDVVEYTGTDVAMTLTNGWGDWNLPYTQYRAGSALS